VATRARTPVYLEVGAKKVFACALAWPGWCRAAKSEELALEALAAYGARYGPVAERAGLRFPAYTSASFDVVATVKGSGATDFGLPDKVVEADTEPSTAAQARRGAALVAAAWAAFDDVVAVTPESLRKGPRGGGRDRDTMTRHVISSEASYARMVGVRHKEPALDDRPAIEALRGAILEVLEAPSDGAPLTPKGWPLRYAVRRIAWHVLDHAWEMQDRTETP